MTFKMLGKKILSFHGKFFYEQLGLSVQEWKEEDTAL